MHGARMRFDISYLPSHIPVELRQQLASFCSTDRKNVSSAVILDASNSLDTLFSSA